MKLLKIYPLTIACSLLILLASLLPISEKALQDISLTDKGAHFIMYCLLSLAVWTDCLRHSRLKLWLTAIVAIICPAIFGGLIELAQQYLTRYRTGDWLDFAANCIGVAIGSVCFLLFLLMRSARRSDADKNP